MPRVVDGQTFARSLAGDVALVQCNPLLVFFRPATSQLLAVLPCLQRALHQFGEGDWVELGAGAIDHIGRESIITRDGGNKAALPCGAGSVQSRQDTCFHQR